MESTADSKKQTKIPHVQLHVPREIKPSHIAEKHLVGLEKLIQRAADAKTKLPVENFHTKNALPFSTFPNREAITTALKSRHLPEVPLNDHILKICDQYCGWGIIAPNKTAAAKLIGTDPSKWTLQLLRDNKIDFVITKEVHAMMTKDGATVFPNISRAAEAHVLRNESALAHLRAADLQQAVNPSHPGWKAVSEAKPFEIVFAETEQVVCQRGTTGKIVHKVGQALVVVAFVVETAYFVQKHLDAARYEEKVVNAVDYGVQVSLLIGGYFLCEKVGEMMAVAGVSGLLSGGATFVLGLVLTGLGVGATCLIRWASSLFEAALPPYCPSLRFEDTFPLFEDDPIFRDALRLLTTDVRFKAEELSFKRASVFAGVERVKGL